MPNPLQAKSIALGVSGSIACYKAIDLASKMVQLGASVNVMMSKTATQFVSPITFASITHRPVATNLFDPKSEISIDHVSIAENSDIIVIAPATAQTIAKLSLGLADDVLTTTVLASKAPVIICPAMDAHMYDNPVTQHNLSLLATRGVRIAGPAEGHLASGLIGMGRLIETEEILSHIRNVLGINKGLLAQRKIVITAGGTQENIDPVRFISNKSSGKMGYAIAEAARDQGADAVVIAAHTTLQPPTGVRVIDVQSAKDMKTAVFAECEDADALIMAAAVADWRPKNESKSKLKKEDKTSLSIELERTDDILAEINRDNLIKVGFAAESENLLENARKKITSKKLDLIVANDITVEGSGFGSDTNKVTLIDSQENISELDLMPKYEVSCQILRRVASFLENNSL